MIIAIGTSITAEMRIYTYIESKKETQTNSEDRNCIILPIDFFNFIFISFFIHSFCTCRFDANEHKQCRFDETQFKKMPKQGDEIVTLLI